MEKKDEHLSIVSYLKSVKPDGALLVTTPQKVATSVMRKEIDFCKKMKLNVIGIVENMSGYVCPCCSEVTEIFPGDGGSKLCEEYEIGLMSKIPIDPNLGECGELGLDFISMYPESVPSKNFIELGKKLIERLKEEDNRFIW